MTKERLVRLVNVVVFNWPRPDSLWVTSARLNNYTRQHYNVSVCKISTVSSLNQEHFDTFFLGYKTRILLENWCQVYSWTNSKTRLISTSAPTHTLTNITLSFMWFFSYLTFNPDLIENASYLTFTTGQNGIYTILPFQWYMI